MKPNKRQYIDFIIDELNKGNVQYKEVMLAFVSKFELTEQTFVRYWKTANEAHREAQQAIKEAKEVQTITNEIDKLKTLNLTKIDRMKIAEGIAMGKAKRIEGQIIIPSHADQLKALDYLAKIDGDYAPAKIANTDSEGKDKDSKQTMSLDDALKLIDHVKTK
jgi:hypothetical protein